IFTYTTLFRSEERDQGRRGLLQQLELGRTDDDQLVATLNSNLYLERDRYHQADYEKAMKGLTAEEVSSALRRHINPDRLSYGTAGDFEQGDDSASSGEADDRGQHSCGPAARLRARKPPTCFDALFCAA